MDLSPLMPIIKFEYFPVPYINPETRKQELSFRPYIPIRLGYKKTIFETPIMSLVDSGADRNLFPASVAHALGVKVEKGKVRQHYGIGDVSVLSYAHKIKLFVGERSFETIVDFSNQQTIPLLGRLYFFNQFSSIQFFQKRHYLELEY